MARAACDIFTVKTESQEVLDNIKERFQRELGIAVHCSSCNDGESRVIADDWLQKEDRAKAREFLISIVGEDMVIKRAGVIVFDANKINPS